ncbi:MAG: hypothetical protein M5U26_25420 [Planctomycetota bacterium]|nr:hypothetical protein [Planctomycetota bacterium]
MNRLRQSPPRPSSRPRKALRGSQMLQRHCRACGGVLRPYGETGRLACERCQQVVEVRRRGY